MIIYESQAEMNARAIACEVCGVTHIQVDDGRFPSGRQPISAAFARLSGGKYARACYCPAHGGEERAIAETDDAV